MKNPIQNSVKKCSLRSSIVVRRYWETAEWRLQAHLCWDYCIQDVAHCFYGSLQRGGTSVFSAVEGGGQKTGHTGSAWLLWFTSESIESIFCNERENMRDDISFRQLKLHLPLLISLLNSSTIYTDQISLRPPVVSITGKYQYVSVQNLHTIQIQTSGMLH